MSCGKIGTHVRVRKYFLPCLKTPISRDLSASMSHQSVGTSAWNGWGIQISKSLWQIWTRQNIANQSVVHWIVFEYKQIKVTEQGRKKNTRSTCSVSVSLFSERDAHEYPKYLNSIKVSIIWLYLWTCQTVQSSNFSSILQNLNMLTVTIFPPAEFRLISPQNYAFKLCSSFWGRERLKKIWITGTLFTGCGKISDFKYAAVSMPVIRQRTQLLRKDSIFSHQNNPKSFMESQCGFVR